MSKYTNLGLVHIVEEFAAVLQGKTFNTNPIASDVFVQPNNGHNGVLTHFYNQSEIDSIVGERFGLSNFLNRIATVNQMDYDFNRKLIEMFVSNDQPVNLLRWSKDAYGILKSLPKVERFRYTSFFDFEKSDKRSLIIDIILGKHDQYELIGYRFIQKEIHTEFYFMIPQLSISFINNNDQDEQFAVHIDLPSQRELDLAKLMVHKADALLKGKDVLND